MSASKHANRAWVASRVVYVELTDGRVLGLPARHVEQLAALMDNELARVSILHHSNGDALEWRWDDHASSIALWDFVEGAPRAVRAWVEGRTVLFELRDGRVFGFPATHFQRLAGATNEQLAAVAVSSNGYGLRWEAVDEDISVPGIVSGRMRGP